jgi:hypothetical protein
MRKLVFIVAIILSSLSLRAQNGSIEQAKDQIHAQKKPIDSLASVSQSKLDSLTRGLNNRLDSLNKIGLSASQYLNASDSLLGAFQNRISRKVKHMHDSVKLRLFGKMHSLDSLVAVKRKKIDSLKSVMGISDQFPKDALGNIPVISEFDKLNIPYKQWSLPSINEKLTLENPFGSIESFSGTNFPKLNLGFENLTNLKLPDEIMHLREHFEKLKILTPGTLSKDGLMNTSQQVIQNQLGKVSEMGVAQNNLTEATKVKEMMKEVSDNMQQGPENIEAKAKEEFVDYLKGHEEKVQKDMEDIGKLQLKYRNVADVRLLPKRPPNEMKDKPFIERLIPALTLQTYIKTNTGIDVAPSLGYRISGRIRAGIGGFRRIVFQSNNNSLTNTNINGIRLYNEFRFWKSNYVHLELEHSNSTDPNPYAVDQNGNFINKVNFGLYRTYRITKHINGHALFLYDLKQISNFPNTSHSSLRFGIDVQLVKKSKK